MSGLPTLASAPGLFPAIDMPLGQAIVTANALQACTEEITALKFGSQVIEGDGFFTTQRMLGHIGNALPICYDGQKRATDVPFMVDRQVAQAAEAGVSSYIGSPLGAGSNEVEGKEGTLEAFVAAAKLHNITPIVVLEMTQPGALAFSSPEQAEDLARRAYELGVRYFVAPASKPDRIAAYRKIIGNDAYIISPGVGAQKTGDPIQDAVAAVMAGADYIVAGRAIYGAADPVAAVKALYAAIREAHLTRKFVEFIVENDVVGFFEQVKTLKCGIDSHWYANWRTIGADPFLMDQLTGFLLGYLTLKGIGFDTIYGVPEGATKLAILAQDKWAKGRDDFAKGSHVLAMGRGGGKKAHGDKKDASYIGRPMGRTVVVEDVTTTAGSLVETIKTLQGDGVDVVAAVGLTNRLLRRREDGKSAAEAVAELGITLHSMSTAAQFLPRVAEKLSPSEEIRADVNREFREDGVEPLEI